MRPSVQDVFGFNAQWVSEGQALIGNGLYIPETSLYPEGGYPGNLPADPQKLFMALVLRASRTLNEANRNNNSSGIVTTITYGEYDNIIDPPGSTNVFRRDVFSLIAYQPQSYAQFDPNAV